MKNLNGNFIIRSNESSIKSLLNRPHQPGQVLLPLDTSHSTHRHFSLQLRLWTTRGRRGCPQGKPHCWWRHRDNELRGKSRSIQHPFLAVLRDGTPGTHPMSPTSDAAWPRRYPQIPRRPRWAATACLRGALRAGLPATALLMTFQSSSPNISRSLLSPRSDYCFPCLFSVRSAEGSPAVPAAPGKGAGAKAGGLAGCDRCKAHSWGLLLRR